MKFFTIDFRNYEEAIGKEWLLTNGLGGYASSTLIGANTRRYHSLLTVSKNPPVDRTVIVSKVDDIAVFKDMEMSLASQRSNGHVTCGFCHLLSIEIGDDITYTFLVRQATIKKKIELVKEQDRIRITYSIINPGEPFILKIIPLLNARYFHYISRKENLNVKNFKLGKSDISLDLNDIKDITIEFEGCEFEHLPDTYYYNMEYDHERKRGLDYVEDHFIPGSIIRNIKEQSKEEFIIDIYIGKKCTDHPKEEMREYMSYEERLKRACDDFVVNRKSTDSYSIIAGYPWFNDWGRDTMISLPGILLETGRFDIAKEVLRAFAKYERDGLIPNMLPDGMREPLYNTVDASLWFVNTLYELHKKTGDDEFVKNEMIPVVKSIIENYRAGTKFNIKMDTDGLISAGDEHVQLTWMDAKIGDFVVTPRHGKAVEINALWYNALSIMYEMTQDMIFRNLAEKVFKSFNEKFVDFEGKMLFDVIDSGFEKKKSYDLRPNAIFSISLPFPVLDKRSWKGVFDRLHKELYTPYGLRSLSYLSKDYRGYYGGDQFERDTAYHQGTVWAWLIGPFIEAYLKIYNDKDTAYILIEPLLNQLDKSMVNTIAEIFEGSYPHRDRGAPAQAWSVAELLRALKLIRG